MRTTDPGARTGPFRTTTFAPEVRPAARPPGGPNTTPTADATKPHGAAAIRWTRLIRSACGAAREWAAAVAGPASAVPAALVQPPTPPPPRFARIRRVVLADEVARTLFADYAAHRATPRGAEETGWVLLGVRAADEAHVLAALPAPTARDAGEAHVWVSGTCHLLATRAVREHDKRVMMLGVAHTHPGSLRHPSSGDLRGDRDWVPLVRGGEGVFGIGTADGGDAAVPTHPPGHAQRQGGLQFNWYTLAAGDKRYRRVPVAVEPGPDLAAPLRPVWDLVEQHADRLERLAGRFRQVRFEAGEVHGEPALSAAVGLGEPGELVRVLLLGKSVRFFHQTGDTATQFDLPAGTAPDHGVYLLLADLAARG